MSGKTRGGRRQVHYEREALKDWERLMKPVIWAKDPWQELERGRWRLMRERYWYRLALRQWVGLAEACERCGHG